jgi:hypothetical protein
MRLTVQFDNGVRGEALLLASNGNQMRVIVAGRVTTEDWLIVDRHWFDAKGRPVEVDALIAVDRMDYSQLADDARPRTATAGGFGASIV